MDMASSPSSWPKDTNSSMLEGGRKGGPRNVRSRTRPAPPRRGPGPGRRRSEGDDPAVQLVPRRSCKL